MYYALSLTLSGTEQFAYLLRVLIAYGAAKFQSTLINALRNAFPLQSSETHIHTFHTIIDEAIHPTVWGSDYHLFTAALLLDRPIIQYNSFYETRNHIRTLTMADTTNIQQFTQRFSCYDPDTRTHILYCNNVHRTLLAHNGISALNSLPLSLVNINNYH